MKRLTLIVALLLMVSMPMMAERISPETARKVATTFLNNNGAKANQLTDLSKEAGFPNLYIFTTEESFVVMTADDRVQPILGYSLTGKFVAEHMTSNVTGWLQGYDKEIQYAIDSKMKAAPETTQLWKDLKEGSNKAGKANIVVNALVQTRWDQHPWYNSLCPYSNYYNEQTVTGCVATAMAQIMKYWQYPSRGIGSNSYEHTAYYAGNVYHDAMGTLSADFGATTYDWDNMPNSLSNSSSATQINAIATLMYHCGVSVNMDYGVASIGGSGAVTAYVADALQTHFNYQSCTYRNKDDYDASTWANMLKAELNAGRPLQYCGSGEGGGHSFVCDGYDSNNKFHFNWGWSGQNDAFYALSSLVPGSGGAGGGSYNFTNGQGAIFGIHPSECTLDAPVNLSHTIAGLQNVTLTWTAVSGATSYNVYRNGNLVGNTTDASFTETAPFGTNAYWVRCVDANNEMSLASNYTIAIIDYNMPVVNDLTASYSNNNVSLSWTAPNWCYPETPSATLTYGNGNMQYMYSNNYWAHRYLASNNSQYTGKVAYKIAFYAIETGSYTFYVYKGSTMQVISGENVFFPTTLMTSKTIEVSATNKWIDVDLDEVVTIDDQEDIWVIVYDPINGNGRFSAALSVNTESNNHGGY